jgi:hypothetical protein
VEIHINRKFLDELLLTYFLESESPKVDILEQWVNRYPQFEKELRDFTVAWSMIEFYSEGKAPKLVADRNVLTNETRILEFLNKAKIEQMVQYPDKSPIKSLIMEAEVYDITIEALAITVDLSVPIVAKLDSRLIEYFSIPFEVIEGLAQAIRKEIILIARYLNQAPRMPRMASYKSHRKPKVPQKENFFDVIRHDDKLSDQQRMRWLSLENSKKGS